MGVSDLREKSEALGDPRHVVDDVGFYVESPLFGRNLTRCRDAENVRASETCLVSWRRFVAELTLLNCVCSQWFSCNASSFKFFCFIYIFVVLFFVVVLFICIE